MFFQELEGKLQGLLSGMFVSDLSRLPRCSAESQDYLSVQVGLDHANVALANSYDTLDASAQHSKVNHYTHYAKLCKYNSLIYIIIM